MLWTAWLLHVVTMATQLTGKRRLVGATEQVQTNRVLEPPQASFFVQGNLGVVKPSDRQTFPEAATEALMKFLKEYARATGTETLIPVEVTKNDGQKHVRFHEQIRTVPVELASLMMHVDEEGRFFAANGEFVSAKELRGYNATLDCKTALKIALEDSGIIDGVWVSNCTAKAIVRDDQAQAHIAWKRDVLYGNQTDQRDTLYASAMTGTLVARHAQYVTASDGFIGGKD